MPLFSFGTQRLCRDHNCHWVIFTQRTHRPKPCTLTPGPMQLSRWRSWRSSSVENLEHALNLVPQNPKPHAGADAGLLEELADSWRMLKMVHDEHSVHEDQVGSCHTRAC